MKRHQPKYFRDYARDPEEIEKSFNRKKQMGFLDVDPTEEKIR